MKNRRTLFIIIGLVVLILAALTYVLLLPKNGTINIPQQPKTPDTQVSTGPEARPAEQPQPTPEAKAGSYVDYSETTFAQAAETRRILFFHAPWCPQCRELEASIKAGTVPNNVTILKVDFDSMQALRQKYGVTLQTTLVEVDANGGLVKKFVAYDDPTLAAVKQAFGE